MPFWARRCTLSRQPNIPLAARHQTALHFGLERHRESYSIYRIGALRCCPVLLVVALSVVAKRIGCSREYLSRVIHGHKKPGAKI